MKKRKRGRPRGRPLSGRELAARRVNLEKARSAPRDVIYRPTARRLAASLDNLRKAIAARRSKEGYLHARMNALKHGVFARQHLGASVRMLGEDPREFAAHHELFRRFLVPRNDDEAALVFEMANLAWRRLRLFHAAAVREGRDLRVMLGDYPPPAALNPADTEMRGYDLLGVLNNCDRVVKDASKLCFEMRTLLGILVERRGREEQAPGAGGQVPGKSAEETDASSAETAEDVDLSLLPLAPGESVDPQGGNG